MVTIMQMDNVLTLREVSELLPVCSRTLRQWCDTGRIRAYGISQRSDRLHKLVLSKEKRDNVSKVGIVRFDENRRFYTKMVTVSAEQLGINCWLSTRFLGSACDQYFVCKYARKANCWAGPFKTTKIGENLNKPSTFAPHFDSFADSSDTGGGGYQTAKL